MRIALPLLVSALLLLPTFSFAQKITIATFNTEFLTRPKVHIKFGFPFNLKKPADKKLWSAPGFRDRKFNEAAQVVAKVITQANADVVVLIEVGNAKDVEELASEISKLGIRYEHKAVCDCTDSVTKQHVAVLSKIPFSNILTAIPGRESYDGEPDDPETERDTGLSKAMKVVFRIGTQNVHLYAVHLASERGGHEQDSQRIAQASIIRRHYLPLLNAGEHIILAGDLNDHRGQPTLRRIRGKDDIWQDLIQTGQVKFFAKGKEHTRWTYRFQGVRRQIDHILLSPSIKNIAKRKRGITAKVIPKNDSLASDHRPFIVILDLK